MKILNHKQFNKKKGIYLIRCTITSKVYIGSTCECLYKRQNYHIRALKNGNHSNNYLQNAWNKYGEENFEFDILEILDLSNDEILKREEYYINILESHINKKGFNIYEYSNTSKGNRWSDEAKSRRKGFGKGRIVTDKTKKLQSLVAIGKVVSIETKMKMKYHPKNTKPVVVLNLNGDYIGEFRNPFEVCEYLNVSSSIYVYETLAGKKKTCKKHRVIWKDKYDSSKIKPITAGDTVEVIQMD